MLLDDSVFLKKEELEKIDRDGKGKIKVCITGEGYWHEFSKTDGTKDKRLALQVAYMKENQEEKGEIKLNWTSYKNIVSKLGKETKKWIGTFLIPEFAKTKVPGKNDLVDTVYWDVEGV